MNKYEPHPLFDSQKVLTAKFLDQWFSDHFCENVNKPWTYDESGLMYLISAANIYHVGYWKTCNNPVLYNVRIGGYVGPEKEREFHPQAESYAERIALGLARCFYDVIEQYEKHKKTYKS